MSYPGANWFYAIGQDRHGPIDINTLRQMLASGQLYPNTLVWSDGMPNWVAAITHPDLAVAAQQPMGGSAPMGMYNPVTGAYAPPGATLQYYSTAQGTVVYAGFWLRFAAWVLDFLLVNFAGCIVGVVVGLVLTLAGGAQSPNNEMILNITFYAIGFIISWLYYALMESSAVQGTVGKIVCGVRVTGMGGERISFARATGRHFAKIISGVILGIGYVMAGFTEQKQGLHDIIAGALVVRK